ncbi:MAG: hypothetical protein C0403_01280 [Desulfobacterium sp.]|nr:hypothetical protein [Desulfobacterium sp.]
MINFLEIGMNFSQVFSGTDAHLAEFVCRFLEENGALLEKRNKVVEALLPKELAESLGVEEHICISPETETKQDARPYPVHFGSPLLDRTLAIAGSRPSLARCELTFYYLKKSGFDHLIKEQFTFSKSIGEISSVAEFRTQYIIFTCRYLAQSDEQKEGLVTIPLHEETGAFVPELDQLLLHQEKSFSTNRQQIFTKNRIDHLMTLARPYISEAVEEKTIDFRKSMNRRFFRDSTSLEEYYQALTEEMKQSLSRSGLSDRGRAEREEKIALIPQELALKKKDLLTKYSIKVNVSLSAVMIVTTPAVRIHFSTKAGNVKKMIPMTYNPISKLIDPLVCESCKRSMYRIGFCKNMHLICTNCHADKCSRCDENY